MSDKTTIENGKWIEHPSLKDIPHSKLEFLQIMVFESKDLKADEMLPFFMSVIKISKEKNITFTEQEMDKIILVLKEFSDENDLKRITQIMEMRKQFT